MTDSYIDLTLKENDVKLKVIDQGDGTYALATDVVMTIGDVVAIDQTTPGGNHVEVTSIPSVTVQTMPSVSGTVTINPTSSIVSGRKLVAASGTAVVLGSSTTLYAGVKVRALHANSGWIYVGPSGVAVDGGYVLDAGEEVFIEVNNLSSVYINASVNNDGVSYLGS